MVFSIGFVVGFFSALFAGVVYVYYQGYAKYKRRTRKDSE